VAVDGLDAEPERGDAGLLELDDERALQLYVPVGFGHGFCVTSEVADFVYKCTAYYDPATEAGIKFDDPDVGVDWGSAGVELLYSQRDAAAPRLSEIADSLPFTV
jgi:dTDP-4-dehydrorhamnose 3,5-epimerase